MTLPINQVAGPLWVGEGPYLGRLCHVIAFGRCNLHCPGCDVPQTWDEGRYDLDVTCPPATPEEIVDRLEGTPNLIMLTGGEPLLHQRRRDFVELLDMFGHIPVHVETNGTIPPTGPMLGRIAHFSVSLKLNALGGGDPQRRRIRALPIAVFNTLAMEGRAAFKFVCATAADVEEVSDYCRTYGIPRQWVWISPYTAGYAPMSELPITHRKIGGAVAAFGFNLTTRLQVVADFATLKPRRPVLAAQAPPARPVPDQSARMRIAEQRRP